MFHLIPSTILMNTKTIFFTIYCQKVELYSDLSCFCFVSLTYKLRRLVRVVTLTKLVTVLVFFVCLFILVCMYITEIEIWEYIIFSVCQTGTYITTYIHTIHMNKDQFCTYDFL